uniref:10 kDa heat shock protein, mitochondrial n=1 Tax=Podarcis muralis TaxID=64176 RepID=A0A670JSU2_PODMU
MPGKHLEFSLLFGRVLAESCAPKTVTKGSIMTSEKSQGEVQQATILATGSKGKDGGPCPLSVKAVLPEYVGTKAVHDDKDYFIFRDGDKLEKCRD